MRSIDQSKEQVEDLLAARGREIESLKGELEAFSYTISHDLRAPLRAIAGFSEILLENYGPDLPEEAIQLVERVKGNARHMAHLIEELLSFSQLSQRPITKEMVQPAELARRALVELAAEQRDRMVEITIGKMPACQGDPELLQRVFVNLLSNALKYTRSQSTAHIRVGSCKVADLPAGQNEPDVDSTVAAYFVGDNGVGFDMQYADNLFGIFQRLHSASDYEGTGMGLATVQRIVQRHGGVVWAAATPEQGATFYFTLGDQAAAPQRGKND